MKFDFEDLIPLLCAGGSVLGVWGVLFALGQGESASQWLRWGSLFVGSAAIAVYIVKIQFSIIRGDLK